MAAGRFTLSDAQIAQILSTMTEHLGRMTDPSYGKKLRQDLLTLPDEVQAQLTQAQETIAKADSIKAALKHQEDEASERLSIREKALIKREQDVEAAKSIKTEAEKVAAANKDKESALKKEADRLESIAKAQADTDKKHKDALNIIAEEYKKLDARKVELDNRQKSIEDYEREIDETAQQMSGLVKARIRK